MDLGMKGQVALITGAARGIGRCEAEALAAEGCHVALNDLDANTAQITGDEIARDFGVTTRVYQADVTDNTAVGDMISAVLTDFERLDILINNAGVAGKYLGHRVEDLPPDYWDTMFASHARSSFLCCHHAVPHFKARGYGRIINTSSQNYTGGGRPGVTNYAAAKAAIAGFTRTLAKEVAEYGATANAVAPGYVETDLIKSYSPHNLH
ncbi:MAG: SDR family NAD(P)-dependent oxidoreductase, partial [Pseudomonadota bacterium]